MNLPYHVFNNVNMKCLNCDHWDCSMGAFNLFLGVCISDLVLKFCLPFTSGQMKKTCKLQAALNKEFGAYNSRCFSRGLVLNNISNSLWFWSTNTIIWHSTQIFHLDVSIILGYAQVHTALCKNIIMISLINGSSSVRLGQCYYGGRCASFFCNPIIIIHLLKLIMYSVHTHRHGPSARAVCEFVIVISSVVSRRSKWANTSGMY